MKTQLHTTPIIGPNGEDWLAAFEYLPGRPMRVDRDRREDPAELPEVHIHYIFDEDSSNVILDSLESGKLEDYQDEILEKWEPERR